MKIVAESKEVVSGDEAEHVAGAFSRSRCTTNYLTAHFSLSDSGSTSKYYTVSPPCVASPTIIIFEITSKSVRLFTSEFG